ncbi:hypothetical protein MHU86_16183 [Fragilaria crotonensis]|nr:hypothetical protein MHU86_16183 [Fragilaria crotonensis]
MNFAPFQGDRHHQRLVDAFVDDTSMGFTSPGDHTYEELIVRLQNVAQTWEHLLYLSGGKLNLSKCSWYVMYWEWDKGRPKLREITPADPTIRLHHGSQESTTVIRRTSVDESTRMLGVYLNPMGDFGHHIKILRQKADGYASRLSASRLTAQDIRIFHRSIYVPAMRYSLAALSVDEEALSGVQTNILKVMLQKMHVSGNLPTSIRHGPIEMGGLGMYDLRTEAGIEAIKFLRNSVYTDSEAGNLIRINLQYSQLESGIDTPTPIQRRLWKRFICSSYLRYVPFWKISPLLSHSLSTDASAESSPTSFASLTEYVRTLPNTQRRLLADLQQQASDVQVWRAFRSKAKLYIASDGRLDGNRGTHGWVLASKKHVLFRCSGPVDGFVSTESSTRSELAGCASSLLLITIISRMWGLRHRCSFCWITDSRAAISRITRYVLPGGRCIKQMPDDADLISLIATLYRELRRPFRPEWVKGHQDSLQSYEHLPFKARLNIDADFLATRYRLRGRLKSSPLVDHQIGQKVSILINGKRLTSQFDSCIRYHINGYHLRRYMQERHAWSDCTWEDIDFHLFGQHFKRLPPHLQVTHMKRVHGQLPLGTRRYEQSRIKEPTLKLCPCCKLHEETADHLLRCIENLVHATSLQQLRRDLLTGDIHPARYLIMEGIEFWTTSSQQFSPTVHQYPAHLGDHIAAALESQGRIGWQEATSGLLSKQWSVLSCLDMHSPNRTNIDAGMKRMKSFMTAIHAHTTRLWMARNEVLHSTQDGEQANIRSSEAAEIRSLHQQPHLLRAGDRHYCERSLERLLQGSSSMRRRWLRRVRQSIAEHQSDGGRQSLITTYFASTTG